MPDGRRPAAPRSAPGNRLRAGRRGRRPRGLPAPGRHPPRAGHRGGRPSAWPSSGAAFMLAWAAEASQVDISAGLALALLALVAVLPEYAVDFVFTWKAGKHPAEFAPDALANMTGGNQLLIGAGWSLVVLVAAYRIRSSRRGHGADERARDPGDDRRRARPQPQRRDRVLVDRDDLRTHVAVAPHAHVDRRGDPRDDLRRLHGARRARAGRDTAPRRSVAHDRLDADAHGGARSSRVVRGRDRDDPRVRGTVRGIARRHRAQVRDRRLRADLADRAARVGGARAVDRGHVRVATRGRSRASARSCRRRSTSGRCSSERCRSCSRSRRAGCTGSPIDAVQREELFVTAAQSAFAVAVLANRKISVREASMLLGVWISGRMPNR